MNSTMEIRSGEIMKDEFGVCDECGEYTEALVLIEGTWICKDCSYMT